MKKLWGTMGLAAAAAVLSACGGGSDEPANAQPQGAVSAPEAQSAPMMVKGWHAFDGQTLEEVTFEDRDGWAHFQGDIILGRTEQLATPPTDERRHALGIYKSNAIRWQNGVVVYDASQAPANQLNALRTAMWHISRNTPVRFTRDWRYASGRMTGTEMIYDGIAVLPETDPHYAGSSSVGKVGGIQNLRLRAGNPFETAAATATHELVHALGAWHEQSRADRDSFVAVNYANILPGYESQFSKHISDGAMHAAYDYCSLMHYGRKDLSRSSGLETMTPLRGFSCGILPANGGSSPVLVNDIGQEVGLSQGDKSMISYLYASAPANRPQVHAGHDQTLKTGCNGNATLTLEGFGEAVSGAGIKSYKWIPRAGTTSDAIANSTSAKTQVSVPKPMCGVQGGGNAVYQFELKVEDTSGRSMSDVVTFTLQR